MASKTVLSAENKKKRKRKGYVDVADILCKEQNLTKRRALQDTKNVVAAIQKLLSRGHTVAFPGFGAFEVRIMRGRVGRNPQNGDSVNIPAKCRVVFIAGMQLKRSLPRPKDVDLD